MRSPGFPVAIRGVDQDHAVFFKENRTRSRRQQREVGNPGTLRSGLQGGGRAFWGSDWNGRVFRYGCLRMVKG
jgi:hypothetical protein